ncbi:2-amino-4-hydroxy-6-hydroxymethyldihydropteridine diphosphokinase [Secundilactobacillus odoratitofui]|uniref:2-amino-4-hydroxy-6- hydroxymethyldihydropteridine diphosphokinase n=1 Tax=Secundilactobacillus odoratitofui TaxID=480930 RepID=UPI000B2D3F96|nr:2-amino-4-hydroxy-6-hydroxymethyldihydropteridine diphosphokinase [Secundilactobacillus odoratitofui]
MGVIRIHNLKFHTFNGVFPEERKNGQQLAIDVALNYPIEARVQHDDLDETISYADVNKTIDQFVHTHSYKLIESLANELLKTLLANFPMATSITLKIRKYSVPMPESSMMWRLKWQVSSVSDRVYLSIGSNIGDRLENLNQAVAYLRQRADVQIVRVSSVYETQPWGNLNQANFYNIAVSLTTSLTPTALLDVLHRAEQLGHRQRLEHWGPRTIDLDIVYWGTQRIETPTLTVPHPRAQARNFVLLPVQEIAGDDDGVLKLVEAALKTKQDTSWIRKVEGVLIDNDK